MLNHTSHTSKGINSGGVILFYGVAVMHFKGLGQYTFILSTGPPELQHWPAEEWGSSAATAMGNRLRLVSPGSSLEQPKVQPTSLPASTKAQCSRRRWGIVSGSPGGWGLFPMRAVPGPQRSYLHGPTYQASFRAHPTSPCKQPAQRQLCQPTQQPQASSLQEDWGCWGGGGVCGVCVDSWFTASPGPD